MKIHTPKSVQSGFEKGSAVGAQITKLPGHVVFGLGYGSAWTVGLVVGSSMAILSPVVGPITKKFKEGAARARRVAPEQSSPVIATPDSVSTPVPTSAEAAPYTEGFNPPPATA